ncbi:histone-lysine N-methyltransferase SETMAR [Trichonephila clavipes]|nr:histone-lysine N-methyltransferase SETMAR [Trichonephila clavipes]
MMVTGDEKWVTYYNIVQKLSWSKCGEAAQTVAKPRLTVKKVLLCIWWGWKLTIDQKYPELANRRGVVFHQDNARPHTSVVTRQKLCELGWEVLMHPPYSPDLAPSDYHLFLALQNFLSDKKLGSREDCENRFPEFFASKGQDFYERCVMKLPLKYGNKYATKQCIFELNRTIGSLLKKVLDFHAKIMDFFPPNLIYESSEAFSELLFTLFMVSEQDFFNLGHCGRK